MGRKITAPIFFLREEFMSFYQSSNGSFLRGGKDDPSNGQIHGCGSAHLLQGDGVAFM